MIPVRILRGCVADLKTHAPGDVVEVSDNVARLLIGSRHAEMAEAVAQPAPAAPAAPEDPQPQPEPKRRGRKKNDEPEG